MLPPRRFVLRGLAAAAALAAALLSGAAGALLATCGPFTDVAADAFCPFVLEIFYLGITTGTTATTYDPASNVSRLQMAAFLSRTVDGVLKRGSRRAALDQFWTTQNGSVLGITTVGAAPRLPVSDGADVWVPNQDGGTVSRVRASDGRLLETWTGAAGAYGALSAMGKIFVTNENSNPGKLYRIDPTQPAGVVTTVATNLGNLPSQIAFDGSRLWVGNETGSISIVTPGPTIPWTVTNVGGFSAPRGMVFDGTNVWTLDAGPNTLLRLDSSGNVLQTVTVGEQPFYPFFDGSNIWAPASIDSNVTVVRASTGAVLQILTGNGINFPIAGAFDGQRVLITSEGGNSVSIWKAADLTPIGFFPTGNGTNPWGACSDGLNFWVTLQTSGTLARF